MKLIDRISLGRTIQMFLDFLYKVIKLFAPKKEGSEIVHPEPRNPRKPLFPNLRKKIDEIRN